MPQIEQQLKVKLEDGFKSPWKPSFFLGIIKIIKIFIVYIKR